MANDPADKSRNRFSNASTAGVPAGSLRIAPVRNDPQAALHFPLGNLSGD